MQKVCILKLGYWCLFVIWDLIIGI